MRRDRGLPALEIELQPIAPPTGRAGTPAPPPSTPPRDRRRQLFMIVSAAATVIVLVTLSVVSGHRQDEATPAPASTSAPITAPTTVRTPTPNILGAGTTNLLLWTFDHESRLQVLDLDSGELRPLGPRGGFALFPLLRNVVVFDGGNGSSIVSAIGETSAKNLGPGLYPLIERDLRNLWVLTEEVPRRWQRRAIDGTIVDELPFDPLVSLLPYSDRAVLLVSVDGTLLFDLVTRQRQQLTPVHAIAVGGRNLMGRSCVGQLCTFTVIDIDTRAERVLLSNVPIEDASNATLSPDGAYLAITNRESNAGRHTEIVAVGNGTTAWKSPVGAYGPSAWSWSPDSKWFFVAMSGQQVLAVSIRNPSAQTEIPLSFTPLHGLAVTYR